MTCGGCQAKVQTYYQKLLALKIVNIDLAKSNATIDMDKYITTNDLKEVLKEYPKHQLSEPVCQKKLLLLLMMKKKQNHA